MIINKMAHIEKIKKKGTEENTNIEEKVFDAVKDINKVIISGNLGKCACKESVLKKDFATKIFFSTSCSARVGGRL